MIKEIKPINDCVVVEPIEVGVSAGGVLLPDAFKDKPQRGKVVALGPGQMYRGEPAHLNSNAEVVRKPDRRIRLHPNLKVGDTVLYGRYAGNEVEVEDGLSKSKKVIIMRETDLLGHEVESVSAPTEKYSCSARKVGE